MFKFTITELAREIGVTSKTIMRWEKSGRLPKPKRDWKGWRWYDQDDLNRIKAMTERIY